MRGTAEQTGHQLQLAFYGGITVKSLWGLEGKEATGIGRNLNPALQCVIMTLPLDNSPAPSA